MSKKKENANREQQMGRRLELMKGLIQLGNRGQQPESFCIQRQGTWAKKIERTKIVEPEFETRGRKNRKKPCRISQDGNIQRCAPHRIDFKKTKQNPPPVKVVKGRFLHWCCSRGLILFLDLMAYSLPHHKEMYSGPRKDRVEELAVKK